MHVSLAKIGIPVLLVVCALVLLCVLAILRRFKKQQNFTKISDHPKSALYPDGLFGFVEEQTGMWFIGLFSINQNGMPFDGSYIRIRPDPSFSGSHQALLDHLSNQSGITIIDNLVLTDGKEEIKIVWVKNGPTS